MSEDQVNSSALSRPLGSRKFTDEKALVAVGACGSSNYSQINELAIRYRSTGEESDLAPLYSMLLRFGKSRTKHHLGREDEDLICGVITSFIANLARYRYPARVFMVALQRACWREQARPQPESLEDLHPNLLLTRPFDEVNERLHRERLVRRLKPKEARCVHMLMAGWTLAEIAGSFGIAVPAVRARFRIINRRLAQLSTKNDHLGNAQRGVIV